MVSTLDEIARPLRSAAQKLHPAAEIRKLQPLAGGHAGLTFAFEWRASEGADWQRAVLKMAARGVKRAGAADLYRQARLLQILAAHGVPVPAVCWAEADESALGAPYVVMEFVAGAPLFPLCDAGAECDATQAAVSWSAAAAAVASLQDPQLSSALRCWEAALPLGKRVESVEPTLRKSPESAWLDAGLRARDALQDLLPGEEPFGLVHGDLQTSNVLVDGRRLTAIIDWDLAHLGAHGTDLGWLLMFADRDCWGAHWRPTCPYSMAELTCMAREAGAVIPEALDWYRGYAAYRFGAIACFNAYLHRTGKRNDPVWEKFARDVPRLFARALDLAARHAAAAT